MTNLLTIRDSIKNFLRANDKIATPILKFLGALVLMLSINWTFGYSSILNNIVVVLAISLVCAFISSNLTLLIAGFAMLLHCYSASLEVALVFLILFALMYFAYIRFAPNCAYIVMFTPLLYMLKIHYIIPIAIGIFIGPAGIIPAIFGVIIYYFSTYTKELLDLTTTTTEGDKIQGYSYLLTSMASDKKMILTIVVFSVIILVTYFIYKLSIDYAWYIAIAVGGVLSIIMFLIGSFMLEADTDILIIIIGTLVGTALAFVLQFFRGIVDYQRTEVVQFEDDDYYYYVKAVPKIKVTQQNVNVQKINARVKSKKE